MSKLKLAILPGDGIGQEVTHAAMPIFEALNVPIQFELGDIGWECWKQEGNPIPERTWELIKSCDAILLGATTSKPEREALAELPNHLRTNPPEYVSPIVQLRQKLDLYANVRPCFNIKGDQEDFNFSIIRENTEGLYSGLDFYPLPNGIHSTITLNERWNHISPSEAACTIRLQTQSGLKRLFEFAFAHADKEGFDRVTFADKPNVLRKSSNFSRKIFESISEKHPQIKSDIHNVDAVALWLVKRPHEFGVIVAENMFGDILSDLGAGIMGGLGFAASANIGTKGAYFEPVHGSAPRVSPNRANPSAMFLTISLLLKHLGYQAESDRIRNSVHEVVKNGEGVTYDLGGHATTQEMANAIIDQCLSNRTTKRISILATGSEIIHGDLQDSNSNFFSKLISSNGGIIYQHIQASDTKSDIVSSLRYLLGKSDAVIVTGGLGPTSDDVTRHAIAETMRAELIFDETSWAHIVSRLKQFNLDAADSNRQQALFPPGSTLYPNENGTAFGCHIEWKNKHIFMLPGPPKECRPLFDKYVMPNLSKNNFFGGRKTYRWLTLGLIEGEIAPQVDSIVKNHPIKTAYRWNYPYLEIKLLCESSHDVSKVVDDVNNLIFPYLVSNNSQDAFETLHNLLSRHSNDIYIIDDITSSKLSNNVNIHNLHFMTDNESEHSKELIFKAKSSTPLQNQTEFSGSITLTCEGYIKGELKYKHNLSIANRGPEVLDYGKSYVAWQLCQFIRNCKEQQWI